MRNLQLREALHLVANKADDERVLNNDAGIPSGDEMLVLIKGVGWGTCLVKKVELKHGLTLIEVESL